MHEDVKFPCTYWTYEATTNGSLGKSNVGVIYPCKHCSYELTQKGELKGHKKSVHEGFKNQTNITALKQSWYEILKTTRNEYLKESNFFVHIAHMKQQQMEHLQNTGTKLMKVCSIAATKQLESLKERKKSMHEGVKYQCKYCSYEATMIGLLKEHKRKVHEGV